MNTKITALKKKIEIKKGQLKSKEELAIRSKEAVKEIKHEIELLNNELAKEEMQEMIALMGEKNINMDDVKSAIVSGAIVSSKPKETEKKAEKSQTRMSDIAKDIEEINKEEQKDDTDIG